MNVDAPEKVRQFFDSAPFVSSLGVRLESASPGECTTALAIQPRHLQQDGLVHAGVQATMADHTAGAAAYTMVPKEKAIVSANFTVQLLRPAKGANLRCRAKVVRAGRLLCVVEAEVYCEDDGKERMVSKFIGNMAVIDRETEAPLNCSP